MTLGELCFETSQRVWSELEGSDGESLGGVCGCGSAAWRDTLALL